MGCFGFSYFDMSFGYSISILIWFFLEPSFFIFSLSENEKLLKMKIWELWSSFVLIILIRKNSKTEILEFNAQRFQKFRTENRERNRREMREVIFLIIPHYNPKVCLITIISTILHHTKITNKLSIVVITNQKMPKKANKLI